MARAIIDMQVNFEELAEVIGSGIGFSIAANTPYYVDDLIRAAHNLTAAQFDKDTAVIAASTKSLSHMYEWGTAGINPAPGAARLRPTSAAAKLWRHKLGGAPGSRTIDFTFKPSLRPVPTLTPRSSGISSSNMKVWPGRKHMFAARPWITEYGATVTIKPKYAGVLVIPFRDNPMPYADQRSKDRNYIVTPNPVKVTPGKTLAGNFTSHWYGWWNSEGRVLIGETVDKIVNGDVRATIKTGGSGRPLRTYKGGVSSKMFTATVETAAAEAQAKIKASSSSRRLSGEIEENIGLMNGGIV